MENSFGVIHNFPLFDRTAPKACTAAFAADPLSAARQLLAHFRLQLGLFFAKPLDFKKKVGQMIDIFSSPPYMQL